MGPLRARSAAAACVVVGLAAGVLAPPSAHAQAYLVCGNVACADPYDDAFDAGTGPGHTTGIDDLKLGGGFWDVAFTFTEPAESPFALSTTTAAPGQPLTGIDAGNALQRFYGSIPLPSDYDISDVGQAFITAFGPGTNGWQQFDVALPGIGTQTNGFQNGGVTSESAEQVEVKADTYLGAAYTVWTRAAATTQSPEISNTGAGSGLALILAGVALMRGRKPARSIGTGAPQ
jgi:hypothetical protein